jgi:adenylate kinase family enzyme
LASARRFAVTGTSGSGKTTTGRALAARLGVPFLQLDELNHLPGWQEAPIEQFRGGVEEFTSGDRWVVDGTYHNRIGTFVWERADTLVWLDLPIRVWLSRLVRRAISDIVTQRDLFTGNRQTWRYAFFVKDSLVSYALKQHFVRRREFPKLLDQLPQLNVVRLRSPREVERWLAAQER